MIRLKQDLPLIAQEALAKAEQIMAADNNIHTVGWGEKIKGGVATGNMGLVFTVKKKKSRPVVMVPPSVAGQWTDVVQRRPASIELLRLDCGLITHAQNAHQQCYGSPVPGGVQIQPESKSWVGTLGCKVIYQEQQTHRLCHGAITNWHVATGDVSRGLCQPTTQRSWVGKVAQSPGISFSETNHVDLSVLDIQRVDGPYAPKTHCVKPEQVTLGAYQKELSTGGVGTQVARDGRTLGRITDGECIQVGATIRIGYDAGKTALFTDQLIISRVDGGFSAPGDSGSMVFEYPAMKPFGLLFAGGGGITVVSPVEYVIELGGVHSFQ